MSQAATRSQAAAPSGFLVVDKPGGITSHQVVSRARRALGTKKIGHAGTLDPMATGVLLLGVGAGTRLLGHLTLADKAYTATIRLGIDTVTEDAEGEVTATRGAAGLAREAVLAAAADLTGDIEQVPSAVSAIKVDGQRAYARVRRGEDVQLAGRPVTVSRFDLGELRPSVVDGVAVVDVEASVECTSGTYVRALARDLGEALGTGGHLTALRRTRVGPFTLDDATWQADVFEPGTPAPALLDLADIGRRCFAWVEVDADAARDVGYGRPLAVEVPADPSAVLHGDRLLALYRPAPGGSVPVAVLAQ